jgi:CHAT domain
VRESLRPKGIAMPRIAVLNACRSGEAARAGSLAVEDVRGLMDAFLESGTAAAIGMQGDVRGRAAGLFGTGLYGALAEGLDVDRAVASARQNMVDLADNAQARDWCLPSLTLCVLPEQVLRFECGIEEQDVTDVEADIFRPIELFVDRMPTRWAFARAADPGDRRRPGDERGNGGERPVRVVRVVGDMESGKTWLVQWIRTRLALRGRRVRYVDFKAQDNLDFVRTLEIIRDTPEDVASLAGPAQGAFDRFTFELGHLVNGQIPPEETVGEPPPIPNRLQLGGDNEKLIFDGFRKSLERAAGNGELILIFDHVDGISKTDFPKRIFRHLIEPREPANVRLIVVLSKEEERAYWPSDAERVGARVDVGLLSLDDYDACAEDVVLALGEEFGEDHRNLIDGLKAFKHPPISPRELREIASIVGGR